MGREIENTSAKSLTEYSPVSYIRRSSFCWRSDSFGFLPRSFPLERGQRHSLTLPHPDQVGLEFGEGGEDVEEQLAHRVGRIMDVCPDLQPYAPRSQIITDRAGITDGARQAVEFLHHQRIAAAHGCERLVQTRSSALCTGEAVISIDAVDSDAQLLQSILLSGEVLLVRRAAGITDECVCHFGFVT